MINVNKYNRHTKNVHSVDDFRTSSPRKHEKYPAQTNISNQKLMIMIGLIDDLTTKQILNPLVTQQLHRLKKQYMLLCSDIEVQINALKKQNQSLQLSITQSPTTHQLTGIQNNVVRQIQKLRQDKLDLMDQLNKKNTLCMELSREKHRLEAVLREAKNRYTRLDDSSQYFPDFNLKKSMDLHQSNLSSKVERSLLIINQSAIYHKSQLINLLEQISKLQAAKDEEIQKLQGKLRSAEDQLNTNCLDLKRKQDKLSRLQIQTCALKQQIRMLRQQTNHSNRKAKQDEARASISTAREQIQIVCKENHLLREKLHRLEEKVRYRDEQISTIKGIYYVTESQRQSDKQKHQQIKHKLTRYYHNVSKSVEKLRESNKTS